MSIESAKTFIEKSKTDEDFAKQVKECKDAEARKAFVKQQVLILRKLRLRKSVAN